MRSPHAPRKRSVRDPLTVPACRATLALLLGHHGCAQFLQRPVRDCAVEADALRWTGVTDEQLLALIQAGYVECAAKSPCPNAEQEVLPLTSLPTLSSAEALVLTIQGVAVAARLLTGLQQTDVPANGPDLSDRPHWAAETLSLSFRGGVVKRLGHRARIQQPLLDPFQQSDWPSQIENVAASLPPDVLSLENAVKGLNRNHQFPGLRFDLTADGKGVRWRPLP